MNAFEPDYAVIAWNETHHYRLADGRLDYRFGDSDMTYSIDVDGGNFTLQPRRQTHRHFRTGLILVAFPLVTLGTIYAKTHTVAGLGIMLYIQLGLLVAGLILVARFRQIYRACLLRTASGDAMLIYRDPDNLVRADAFIDRVKLQGTNAR